MIIVAGGGGHVKGWKIFTDALGRPDLFDDPRFASNELRLQNRSELDKQISLTMVQNDREYWLDRFHRFGIPSGALNDLKEGLEHPRFQARDFIKQVQSAAGMIKVFDFPPQFSELKSVNKLGPPLLGEHTRSILHEIGLDKNRVDELINQGVVSIARTPGAYS